MRSAELPTILASHSSPQPEIEPPPVSRRLVRLASKLLGLPVACRLAGDALWHFSEVGLDEEAFLSINRLLQQVSAVVTERGGAVVAPDETALSELFGPSDIPGLRVASLLALPLVTQNARLVGSIVALGTEARDWTAEREVLQELATWTACEVDLRHHLSQRHYLERGRAQMLATERAARAQAEHTERRAVFLAEASSLLDETLDYLEAFARLARLTVPTLADYCLIDEVEADGAIRRVAFAHRDAQRELWLDRGAWHPPEADPAKHPTVQVARSGVPLLVSRVNAEVLDSLAHDEQHRAKLLEIELRSFIIAPLSARGRTLGTITLAAAESGRSYSEQDVGFVSELARRAALALDNTRLYREAQLAVRARENVLAVVSHDLRNPLATVLLNASALSTALPAAQENDWLREPLEWICTSVEQMNRLIEDLLQVSRAEAGTLRLHRAAHAVRQLADDAVTMLRPLAEASRLRLELDVPDGLPRVLVDCQRILQVFSNLIGNSIRFTPPGGRIGITAERTETAVRFNVIDTGPGIDEEEIAHVFTRFWQGERQVSGGSGLGLAIAKGIVEAHGGRIGVTSAPGAGSTFHFSVPLVEIGDG
jgi:signal transduction histidine kinase